MPNAPKHRPETLDAIAARLKRLRIAAGSPTQVQFAKDVGIVYRSWNNYERAVSRIRVDEAIKLVGKFKVTLDWIYLGNERWVPAEILNINPSELESA